MNNITCCLVLAAATVLTPVTAAAQGSVTVFGSVADGSGAAVPGARITATSAQTGSERVAVSDTGGNYVISSLPVGTYTVKAELAGFKTFVQQQIQVQVSCVRRRERQVVRTMMGDAVVGAVLDRTGEGSAA